MLELTVATFRPDEAPALSLDQPDDLAHLHPTTVSHDAATNTQVHFRHLASIRATLASRSCWLGVFVSLIVAASSFLTAQRLGFNRGTSHLGAADCNRLTASLQPAALVLTARLPPVRILSTHREPPG